MNWSQYKQMRLLVMFDIPVEPNDAHKAYTKFHDFLLKDGFIMMQYSIYVRYCHNEPDCEKHVFRVKCKCPEYGNIRLLKITEKQYQNIIILYGNKRATENIQFNKNLITIE